MENFFDCLPQDATEHVQNRPISDWRNPLDPADALSSVNLAHPLSDVARTALTKVTFCIEDDGAVVLEDNLAILGWIDVAGPVLTALHFGYFENISSRASRALRRAILFSLENKCVALRSMSIGIIMNDDLLSKRILQATSGRLSKLRAQGSHTHGIEMYSKGLEELHLDSPPRSLGFFRTVGPTLTTLDTSSGSSRSDARKLLEFMCAFCPILCDVSVCIHLDEMPAFAELLYSYGERLQCLQISEYPVDMAIQLVESCP